MPETRARFLANTIGATSASNDFTLPDGVGGQNQVISSDGAGGTTWANTLAAPAITSVTGKLNEYEDGVSEDGGVLTIIGTDFGNDASALSVQISGTTGFSTVAETTTISITTSDTQFTATFTGAEANYNHSSFAAGSTIYVKVTKSGLQTSTYATLGTAMTGDPSFSTTSTTASTHTGTLAATSLGSYGGAVAGGGQDSNTKLLLNFDRFDGSTDIEDSSNVGGDGHKVTASGNAKIRTSPFGDGKSAIYVGDGSSKITVDASTDFDFGNSDFTIEMWVYLSGTSSTSNYMFQNYGSGYALTCSYNSSHGWRTYLDTSGGSGYTNVVVGNSVSSPTNNSVGWHHVAIVRRAGTDIKQYVDGNLLPEVWTTSGWISDWPDGSSATQNSGTTDIDFGPGASTSIGYIDEIRIVKGVAVYTGNFTVPTSRLSATQSNQGTNIADITGTATKLLIHSNHDSAPQEDNFTVAHSATTQFTTTNLSGLTGSTGNLLISENAVNGGGLSFPTSCNFDYGTDDFVIEWWYRGNFTTDWQAFYSAGGRGANSKVSGNACYVANTDYTINWGYVDSGNNNVNWCSYTGDSTTLPANTWIHIALVKDSTSYRMYIGGTQRGSVQTTGSATNFSGTTGHYDATRNFIIGSMHDQHENVGSVNGHLDNYRISQGTNRGYTGSSITVPTAIFTTDQYTKFLQNLNNGAFADSATSGTTHTITGTGAYHTKAHGAIAPAMTWPASLKKTGSAGVYFDGTGDILEIPASSDWNYSGGNATIELWVYPMLVDRSSANQRIISSQGDSGNWFVKWDRVADKFTFQSTAIAQQETSSTFNTYRWHHFVITKVGTGSGSALKIYVNGVQEFSGSTSSAFPDTGGVLTIGGYKATNGTISEGFQGYIDGVRITHSDESASGGSLYNDGNAGIKVPTQIYGALLSQDVGTIQLNATTGTGGGALDYAELSGGTALSTYGLSLSSSGAITGTLTGLNQNSSSGGVIRIRARANADDNRVTTLGGSSFTGVTQNAGKAPVLFNARRYVGNDTARDITGFGFQPDLVWIKNRDSAYQHQGYDSVRGGKNKILFSDTDAQTSDSTGLTNFKADGFSVGSNIGVNENQDAIIAWAWKAGGAPSSSALSLSGGIGAGTIANNATGVSGVTSITQSVNQNSGLSITKYSGAGQAGSFPHNLGGKPDMVIVKDLTGSTRQWMVWHNGLGDSTGSDHYIQLNRSDQKGYYNGSSNSATPWTSSGHDNSLIRVAWFGPIMDSGYDYICYAWKAVPGVSAFGAFQGATTNNVTVYTTDDGTSSGSNGFQPSFVMIKNTGGTGHWIMWDKYRGFGANAPYFKANDSIAEVTVTARGCSVSNNSFTMEYYHTNNSSNFIYMAFA